MVTWSDLAKSDLKSIFEFIAKDSKYYALKVTNEIVEKSEYLVDFPNLGRITPEFNSINIRELHVCSYRLIYEISSENIIVLAIVHGKRNFQQISEFESEK